MECHNERNSSHKITHCPERSNIHVRNDNAMTIKKRDFTQEMRNIDR